MYSYRFAHSSKLFEVSCICSDTFSDLCDRELANLLQCCWCFLWRVTVSFPYIMSTFLVLHLYVKLSCTCDAIWKCLKPVCMSSRDKNDWVRTADEFYERTNFRTAYELLMESTLVWGSQMRLDLNFSITTTFSPRSSCLWQLQTTVEVGAFCSLHDSSVFKTQHLENYWRAINNFSRLQGSVQWCGRIIHVIWACGWRGQIY